METSQYHCPKCKADSTQSIKMLFQTGVQHGVSRTAMSGVGYGGGGLGVAVGSATTATSSSMALIHKYRMPSRPSPSGGRVIGGWLALFTAAVLIIPLVAAFKGPNTEDMNTLRMLLIMMVTGFGILGGVLLGTYPGHKRAVELQQNAWDARHAYLGRTWVCFRCGAEWQPES